MIPDSITKLSKLIYLDLHGSPKIVALPEPFGDIEGLVHFDLSDCLGIENLPESFGRLNKMVHLNLSNCSHVGNVSAFLGNLTELQYLNLSYCPNIGFMPEAIGCLSKLLYLNLSFSSYLECGVEAEFLGSLTKLEYLNLSSDHCQFRKLPEALGTFIQLKYLNLSGFQHMTELPRLFGSLKKLEHLDLSHCYKVDLRHEDLVGLTNLQYLNLEHTCFSSLPEGLTRLRYLNLSGLIDLKEDTFESLINHISNNFLDLEHLALCGNLCVRSIPESLGSLKKLNTLDLSECILLTKIPESIRTSSSLKFLYLMSCQIISGPLQLGSKTVSLPYFPVHSAADESSSNIVTLQPVDPIELQITKLENVKSAVEVHCIKLVEKRSLEDLRLEWTRDVERFVDDKIVLENLVPPSTLKKLEICGYNSVSFPSWLVGELPNLSKLVLQDMTHLAEWNTSYSNGDEHVIERLEIHDCPMLRMKPLPVKAKSWEISNSDNLLSSWEACNVSHPTASSNSPVTTELSVEHCKVPLHQWRLLQHLSGLSCLSIDSCGDLTGSPETSQHLSSVETLYLKDKDLEELPKWLGELTSLQYLKIRGCRGLKWLNENMRQLTKLQSLELYRCSSMESLPHWLGELTSLKELCMWQCHVLRSLPESIKQLTSLQGLEVSCCPELKRLVESEEGKMKLAHNQERVCGLPTSLKELKISRCDGVRSLPAGIQQLTNLQKLQISFCPELKHVVESEEGQMNLTGNQERMRDLPTSLKELEILHCEGIKSLPEGIQQLTNLHKLVIRLCPELKHWCELEENEMKLAHIENKQILEY